MIEVIGNLWAYPADVRVITTNGTVKKNGECVMGRGCALEAKQRQPRIARELGKFIMLNGNRVMDYGLTDNGDWLMTFPVKHKWMEKADIALIERSAHELSTAVAASSIWDHFPEDHQPIIVMPRPGCGNGGLRWADVKPVLEPILDDRFHIITWGKS